MLVRSKADVQRDAGSFRLQIDLGHDSALALGHVKALQKEFEMNWLSPCLALQSRCLAKTHLPRAV